MGRPQQLSLNVGGATVDQAVLGSIRWAAEVNEIDQDFKKGDDVLITVRARVTDVKIRDTYDAHGNVSATVKTFGLRGDDLVECSLGTPEAYKATLESEDDAAAEKARLDAQQGKGSTNGQASVTQQDGEPKGEPADDRHLASV